MDRKNTIKNLTITLGLILLILTIFDYSVRTFAIPIDPVLLYGIQTLALVFIMIFLVLVVIYIEVRNR